MRLSQFAKRLTSIGNKVSRRIAAAELRSEPSAVEAEVRLLTEALGEANAAKWTRSVAAEMVTPAGRRRLADGGFLKPSDVFLERDSELSAARSRATHRTLLYHVKKRLQQQVTLRQSSSADADGTTGGTYRCLPPVAVANRLGAQPLLGAANLRALAADRLCVADGVLEPALIAGAAAEMRALYRGEKGGGGVLTTDPDDVCNPMQHSFNLTLFDQRLVKHFSSDCPCLARCVAALFNLPLLLQTELGLSLRVPQTAMLAAYPPGAHYRRHMDSYGGRDIPRYVTCLLYLGWEPRSGGQLRAYQPSEGRGLPDEQGGVWANANASVNRDSGKTERHVDVDPLPGRLCVFFSQDVEHEVLKSEGDRFAITLWIWSTEKDDQGR